ENGDVYEGVYAGLYCYGCEEFKTEADLVDGKCPLHDVEPEWLEEQNYFFRLSRYQDDLLRLYDERPDFIRPTFRANEARSFVEGGLRDFSISRATQKWGIPLPWDESQVAYVWADALVNYLSALTYARPGEDLRPVFWPAARHLMAKDILRFHCVYWPAMLLAAGYEVPQQIFVHGYLLLDDQKTSKSRGNILDTVRDGVAADLDRFEITAAVDRIWELVRRLNRYVTERKPWELAKDDARRGELEDVLHELADGLRVSAIALASYLPDTTARILA